ncbi:AAA family ATPase [Gordonia jacobaea]|uniref:AAA family ATPase n=1 Tax=Gordonia jacobaea TaxID=122202 RepID=UPI0022E43F31|nr:AAA family ATPase [Gordonia jacobaea]
MAHTQTAFERVRDAFTNAGLAFIESAGGTSAVAQAPGHSAKDRSVHVTDLGGQVILSSYADDRDDVMAALGLTMRDLFDNPMESSRSHSPDKKVRRGNAKASKGETPQAGGNTRRLAFERVRDAFTNAGLAFIESAGGRSAVAQAPGHSAKDRSVHVTDIGGQVILSSYADDRDDVMAALGLTMRDLFDNRRDVQYRYPDGRVVTRTYDKKFRQSGNTKAPKGTAALYRAGQIGDAETVYITEGEKDVHALETLGLAATCTSQGAGKAHLSDLSPLAGKHVVIVRDKDDPGHRHASQLVALLGDRPASVRVVESAAGKDAADHVAAGKDAAEFVEISVSRSGRQLVAHALDGVAPTPIRWLFAHWLPLGMVTLLAGREGIGKSTLAAWIAAQVTGGALPGALYGKPANVLYIATEDSLAPVVVPRFLVANADLARVLTVRVEIDGRDVPGEIPMFPADLSAIEQIIVRHDVKLVVLDAIKSTMSGKLDSNSEDGTRHFLTPLAQLAATHDVAVLGLTHFGKADRGGDTGKAVLGSIGWSGVARMVIGAAARPDGTTIVSVTKNNVSERKPTAAYTIDSATVDTPNGPAVAGRLSHWDDTVTETVADLMRSTDDGDTDDSTGIDAWLTDYLTLHTRVLSLDIKKDAAKQGFAESTVQRAAKRIGVVYDHIGFPRRSWWRLPDDKVLSAEAIARLQASEPDPTAAGNDAEGDR